MSRVAGAAGGAAASVPVIWSFFGYSFPAGPMVVGVAACFAVRLFIMLDAPNPKGRALDVVVTVIAMLFTAVWIAEQQVDLFAAIGTGGGLGALGNGIIAFFKRRAQTAIDALEALTGKAAVPPEMTAQLREIDRRDTPPT